MHAILTSTPRTVEVFGTILREDIFCKRVHSVYVSEAIFVIIFNKINYKLQTEARIFYFATLAQCDHLQNIPSTGTPPQ